MNKRGSIGSYSRKAPSWNSARYSTPADRRIGIGIRSRTAALNWLEAAKFQPKSRAEQGGSGADDRKGPVSAAAELGVVEIGRRGPFRRALWLIYSSSGAKSPQMHRISLFIIHSYSTPPSGELRVIRSCGRANGNDANRTIPTHSQAASCPFTQNSPLSRSS